jgi:hypothetical protein
MVEERFAKMKEFGEDWDDKPVRQPVSLDVSVSHTARRKFRMTC